MLKIISKIITKEETKPNNLVVITVGSVQCIVEGCESSSLTCRVYSGRGLYLLLFFGKKEENECAFGWHICYLELLFWRNINNGLERLGWTATGSGRVKTQNHSGNADTEKNYLLFFCFLHCLPSSYGGYNYRNDLFSWQFQAAFVAIPLVQLEEH